jgi:hypothetical protein
MMVAETGGGAVAVAASWQAQLLLVQTVEQEVPWMQCRELLQ